MATPWLTRGLVFVCLVFTAVSGVRVAFADVEPPETLEEYRTLNLLTARLRAIKRFDGLILSGNGAMHAIERCDQAEFNRVRDRIHEVISATKESDRLQHDLERRRVEDVKRLKRDRKRLQQEITRVTELGRHVVKSLSQSEWRLIEDGIKGGWENIPRGNPEPLSAAVRVIVGALKAMEKRVSRDSRTWTQFNEIKADLERLEADAEKLEAWKAELTNPQTRAAYDELHNRHHHLIDTAERLLRTMDAAFDTHACAKCKDRNNNVVAKGKPGALEQLRSLLPSGVRCVAPLRRGKTMMFPSLPRPDEPSYPIYAPF